MNERDMGLIFSGGGTASFYHMGVMNRWRGRLLPRVGVLGAVSAGACVAVLTLSEREIEVGELWRERTRGIKRNFDWRRMLAGRRPTPHEPIYRDLLLHALSDGGFERVRSQPFPVLVLATAFPRRMPAMLAAILGIGAYGVETRLGERGHKKPLRRKIGLTPAVFDARQCRTPTDLTNLILASSATPPFTSIGTFSGRRLLDGGLVDNAPVFLAEGVSGVSRSLVLLTGHHSNPWNGPQGPRMVIAPSAPLPLKTWDYTKPELIFDIVAQGERDADLHEDAFTALMSHTVTPD